MSIEYNYDDPGELWPCLGPMRDDELNAEWLRCWRMLLTCGDLQIKPWQEHWLSERVRVIEDELLCRQFLRENEERLLRGEIWPNGAAVDQWRYDRFMGRTP